MADILNKYFINIAEYAAGRQISTLPSKDIDILEINNRHENHISIQNIKNRKFNFTFAFKITTSFNVRQLIFQQKFISQDFMLAIPARKTAENYHFVSDEWFLGHSLNF